MPQSSKALNFIDEPQEYLLRMDEALSMPLGLECVITVSVGNEKFEACVPTMAIVDQNPPTVYGQFVGTKGDNQVIVFPPSSLGTSIWYVPMNVLKAMRLVEQI